MKKLHLLLPLLLVSISFSSMRCKTKCEPSYIVEQSALQTLHNLLQGTAIDANSNSNDVEVYIDYSDGMHPAIVSCNSVFDQVLNSVGGDKTRYLVCGRSNDLQPLTKAELDNLHDPKNAKSFSEDISILDKPLERIVKEGKQAVYITDFELITGAPKPQYVQGGTVMSAIDLSLDWATTYFDKWLSAGNSIDVFAKPFIKPRKKGNQNQYLYFLIFTPRSISNNRVADDLVELQKSQTDVVHLAFSKSRFQAMTHYSSEEQKGLNENIGKREYFAGQGYEYYKMKFEDFKRLEKVEDKLILEKLSINQQLEGFSNLTFHIQVEDITKAYHSLADSMQCGSGTNLDKLKLAGTTVPEYFELETKSAAGDKIEFGIKKHDSFTAIDPNVKSQLFKISILFNRASYQPDVAKMEQVLQWRDANIGQLIPGLYGGLKQAASRMDLKDTPVYTYYIDVE